MNVALSSVNISRVLFPNRTKSNSNRRDLTRLLNLLCTFICEPVFKTLNAVTLWRQILSLYPVPFMSCSDNMYVTGVLVKMSLALANDGSVVAITKPKVIANFFIFMFITL